MAGAFSLGLKAKLGHAWWCMVLLGKLGRAWMSVQGWCIAWAVGGGELSVFNSYKDGV